MVIVKTIKPHINSQNILRDAQDTCDVLCKYVMQKLQTRKKTLCVTITTMEKKVKNESISLLPFDHLQQKAIEKLFWLINNNSCVTHLLIRGSPLYSVTIDKFPEIMNRRDSTVICFIFVKSFNWYKIKIWSNISLL